MKLSVKESLLTDSEVTLISKQIFDRYGSVSSPELTDEFFWNQNGKSIIQDPNIFLYPLLQKVYLNASEHISNIDDFGCEYWVNINRQQGYHYDCDEVLRTEYGILQFPVLSSVYYLFFDSIFGGEIEIYEETTKKEEFLQLYSGNHEFLRERNKTIHLPRPNQLIMFSNKVPHRVQNWSGKKRISIAINFWNARPLQKNHTFGQALSKINESINELIS